jgi:hypothetical protein
MAIKGRGDVLRMSNKRKYHTSHVHDLFKTNQRRALRHEIYVTNAHARFRMRSEERGFPYDIIRGIARIDIRQVLFQSSVRARSMRPTQVSFHGQSEPWSYDRTRADSSPDSSSHSKEPLQFVLEPKLHYPERSAAKFSAVSCGLQ